jgi:ABC-2 type transport system ATP-binding protein
MIQLQEVSKSFGSHTAVRRLTITIPEKSVYALLGANGAGKTTTIMMLLGLLQPDQGTLSVCGINPYVQPDEARKRVAYIPEQVLLYPYLTGLENLDYFCRLDDRALTTNALQKALEDAGLQEEAWNRRAATYSKGMAQKVGIAIALAKKASVLLLDEPTSGLDPQAAHQFMQQLETLKQSGMSILMATHDIFQAKMAADTIGIMRHGTLVHQTEATALSANALYDLYLNYMQD